MEILNNHGLEEMTDPRYTLTVQQTVFFLVIVCKIEAKICFY